MKTLFIAASLFSVQPMPASADAQWVDLQLMQDQVRSYLIEDIRSVSLFIQSTLRDGLMAGDSLSDGPLLSANGTAISQKLAVVHPEHNDAKDKNINNPAVK